MGSGNDTEALAMKDEFLPEPGSGFGILTESRRECEGVMKSRSKVEDDSNELVRLLTAGKLAEAIPLLEDALENFPDHLKAKLYLIECYFYVGKTELAIEFSRKIDSTSIKHGKHCISIYKYLFRNGEFALTIPYVQRAVELDPANGDLHHDLAYLHAKNDDHESAIEAYTKSAELGMSNFTLLRQRLGELLVFRGYTVTKNSGDELFDSAIEEYISG